MASDRITAANPPRASRITNRSQTLRVGDVLADTYELRELALETPDADVFLAFDTVLGREVAIKTTVPSVGFEPLRREAKMLASFGHPNIIGVHGYGSHAGIEYIVLEALHGSTLATYLDLRAGRGGFSASETIEILLGIAESLAVIHAAGATHGHLVPEAVVLASGARIVLKDLSTDASREVSRADDLRALGAIGFQLLTGTHAGAAASLLQAKHMSPTDRASPAGPIIRDLLSLDSTAPADANVIAARLRAIRGAARADRDRKLSIVVADDDPAMRDLLALLLAQAAPDTIVHFAENGVEAIELVEKLHPDLLLLDIEMPGFNGIEVCMYLRGVTAHDRLAICVMSSYATENRSVLARLGILDVFQKGELGPEALGKTLGTLLRKIRVMYEPPVEPVDAGLVGGRYDVGRQLGKGGMGAVYEARHARLGKKFALKVINASLALDAATRTRFYEEAQLASEIDHPNIVTVIDYGEDQKVGAYMVMELVQGTALSDVAKERVPIRRACDLLGQVADALEQIHSRGIIHSDVKAENIMVVEDKVGGRRRHVARLIDFGLARRITRMLQGNQEMIVGTPHYLSPEVCTGAQNSIASDIYALGVLGYFLLAGSLPFDGEIEAILVAHVRRTPDPLSKRRGEPVDDALQALISRAMAKTASERHPSAAAFRYELNNVMSMLGLEGGRLRRDADREQATQDAQIVRLFTRSTVGQAVIAPDGKIVVVNDMFVELGHGDPQRVMQQAPGLASVVEAAWRTGAPQQWHGMFEKQELVVWAFPLWTSTREVHLVAKVTS